MSQSSSSRELASHLAAALRSHRRAVERDGGAVPAELTALEDLFRVSAGHAVSVFAKPCDGGDGAPVTPLAFTYSQAAESLSTSLSTVKRLVAAGTLPAVHIGGAARIRVADLTSYIDGLPARKAN